MKYTFFLAFLFVPALITLIVAPTIAQPPDTFSIDTEVGHIIAHADSLRIAWQSDAALEIYHEALEAAQKAGLVKRLGKIHNSIGQVHFNRSRYREALASWETALMQSQESGDCITECEVLCNLGVVYLYFPNFHKTLSYCQKSLDICRGLGYYRGEAWALCRMGVAWHYLAYYSDALECFQQSLQLFRELGDRQGEGEALFNIGNTYYLLGNREKAHEYDQLSLEIFQETGDRLNESFALVNLGAHHIRDENIDKALEVFHHTFQISQEIGNRYAEAKSLRGLGGAYYYHAYFLTQDYGKHYNKALEYAFPALRIFQELGCRFQEARMLESIGVAYMQVVDSTKTMEYYHKCLQIYKDLDTEEYVHNTLGRIGFHWARHEGGSLSTEVEPFIEAIEIIEKLRGRIEDENHRTMYMAKWFGPYIYLAGGLYELGRYSDLFNYTHKVRARSFLDMLASDKVKVGKSRHAEFLQKQEDFQEIKSHLEKQIAATDDTTQIAELRGRLEEEWQSINALIEEKSRYEPELVSMVTVDALDLSEVQKLLDPKTTILEFFNAAGWQFTYVITCDQIQVLKLVIDKETIAEKVQGLRDAILSGGETYQRSRELYDLLIAPVEDEIETENLIIIPYDSMHYLPFQILQDNEGKYLLERYCISYLPSASVLKYLEAKEEGKGEKLLAFGNPKTGLLDYKSIPFAEQEVRDIIKLSKNSTSYIGVEATEDKFRQQAPDYDILHLACHSELNSSYPLFSRLLLSPGEKHDGNLEVHELFTMDLNANLVVLSACQTALGRLHTAEELVGLTRAFMYAGTPSVISSLWMIKDESTAYLMTQFYKNLKKYNKAEALRRAQKSTKKKYPSPYHWASFVLIGDPG